MQQSPSPANGLPDRSVTRSHPRVLLALGEFSFISQILWMVSTCLGLSKSLVMVVPPRASLVRCMIECTQVSGGDTNIGFDKWVELYEDQVLRLGACGGLAGGWGEMKRHMLRGLVRLYELAWRTEYCLCVLKQRVLRRMTTRSMSKSMR